MGAILSCCGGGDEPAKTWGEFTDPGQAARDREARERAASQVGLGV
jgi:hypothetical protein